MAERQSIRTKWSKVVKVASVKVHFCKEKQNYLEDSFIQLFKKSPRTDLYYTHLMQETGRTIVKVKNETIPTHERNSSK